MFKKFMSKKRNKKRGFTLIELIIVIAIIAILAAIAVPAFGQIRQKANTSADLGNARSIYSVVTAGIADESITLPATGTLSYSMDADPIMVGNANLTNKIAGLPDPKAYQGTKFIVTIDVVGNVEIHVSKNNPSSGALPDDAIEVYPNPEGRYKDSSSES